MSQAAPASVSNGSPQLPNKKRKGGRPESNAWLGYEKIPLPEAKAKSLARNYDGKCTACGEVVKGKPADLLQHLTACDKLTPSDQMAAMTQVVTRGSSGHAQAPGEMERDAASTSGKPRNKNSSPMKKYLDKAPIGPVEMRRLQLLLCLTFVMCGWSFRCVESPFFLDFCQNLRPKFVAPSAWLLRTTLLDVLASHTKLQQAKWMMDADIAYHLTLSADAWSNHRMESIYSWNIIFPNRKSILLRTDDLSSISHTGENIAELMIKEIKKWGPHKFAAVVTDNASNMVVTRRLVLRAFKHMVEVRCMMHAFNTCMGSLMGHDWARKIVKRCSKLVTSIRASHLPLKELSTIAKRMGIKRLLITSNKTRFTSVHASMESVVRLQPALVELANTQPNILTPKALTLIKDDMFFVKLKKLCFLLEPFTLVIYAVQADHTTQADVMRYWMLLAKHITALPRDAVDADFKAHCFTAYNLRHDEMVSPMCKLALFLHPLYRPAVISGKMDWSEMRATAGRMWQNRQMDRAQCTQLLQVDMEQYKLGDAPYNHLPADGHLNSLRLWWRGIQADNPKAQLPGLALLLLDIKPHAADPEKTFSLMGWFNSPRRSRMLNRTTTNMAMVKMHHTAPVDRAAKPFRALEDIMKEEQAAAATVPSASSVNNDIQPASGPAAAAQPADAPAADAQAADSQAVNPSAAVEEESQKDELVEQIEDRSAATFITPAEPMDLASTKEVLELFTEYYKDDCEAARSVIVDVDKIRCSIDFNSQVLDTDFVMQRAAPVVAATMGTSTESFDVMALL